jgi:hypothetical protein
VYQRLIPPKCGTEHLWRASLAGGHLGYSGCYSRSLFHTYGAYYTIASVVHTGTLQYWVIYVWFILLATLVTSVWSELLELRNRIHSLLYATQQQPELGNVPVKSGYTCQVWWGQNSILLISKERTIYVL